MEDELQKRLRKLSVLLETCSDELAIIRTTLSNVELVPRRTSELTKQFELLKSPSYSPAPKRRDMKETPPAVREVKEKQRIQPTLVTGESPPGNLERSPTMPHLRDDEWRRREQEWHERRAQKELNRKPLETLAEKYSHVDEEEDEEEADITDWFIPGFQFKSKGNRKESCKRWIRRMYEDAILKGVNPIRSPEGLEFLFTKIGRVQRGFQITAKETVDAFKSFLAMKQLFSTTH